MTTPKTAVTDLMVLTDRPSLFTAISSMVSEADGVRVITLDGSPRPSALSACLAALAGRPGAVLLLDAEGDPAATLLLVQEIFDRQATSRIFLAGPAEGSELILRSQRAGASEFLPLPLEKRSLLDAVQRLRRKLALEAGIAARRRGRILPFLGTKGGCGTTTLATNLAVSLAGQGHSTLLLDLDLTAADIALLLNLNPAFSVADVAQNVHRLDRELLNGMVLRHASGLDVLTASENPDRALEVEPTQITQILNFLREQFDYIVVNTGDPTDPLALAAVNQADLIHVVSCLDLLALRRAQWALRRIARFGLHRDLLRLVINRYEKNPHISLEEAERILDLKVAWTVPEEPRSFHDALNEGIPLVSRTRNGLHGCFDAYARRLVNGEARGPASSKRRKFLGLFPARSAQRIPEKGASS